MSIMYKKKNFIIVECGNKRNRYYTVVNNNKELKGQHTHVDSFNEAKYVLNQAIKNKIPEDCSSFLKESIKRLIIKNYKSEHKGNNFETVYAERYKTFCRKLNKKEKYYKEKGINVIFLKLNPYGNKGFKAKIIRVYNENDYSKKEKWEHNKNNDTWM